MAAQWSSGKLDHSSHYKDYSDDCYTISGIGTQTVIVKRISETYAVPEWQTGPEAGKCSPLVHLDVFLSAAPNPTATPTPQPSSTPTGTTTATTAPSASPTSNTTPQSNGTPKVSNPATTSEPETAKIMGSVLGATASAKPAQMTTTQPTPTPLNLPATAASYWWIVIILLLLFLPLLWWWKKKRSKHSYTSNTFK
jgi:hypothetical protein